MLAGRKVLPSYTLMKGLGLLSGIGISYYINGLSRVRYEVLDPTDSVEFNSLYPMFLRWLSKLKNTIIAQTSLETLLGLI